MNNFYNFTIPEFYLRYGEDWDDFQTIVDDNVDYTYAKLLGLYWLNDIDRTPLRALEKILNALKINYSIADSIAVKKALLRKYVTKYADKGLGQQYLDLAEAVTGIVGEFYLESERGNWVWGDASWHNGATETEDDMTWGAGDVLIFIVYFDVKTSDSDELDQIQVLLRDKSMNPAFYQMYLIDYDSTGFTILRTI